MNTLSLIARACFEPDDAGFAPRIHRYARRGGRLPDRQYQPGPIRGERRRKGDSHSRHATLREDTSIDWVGDELIGFHHDFHDGHLSHFGAKRFAGSIRERTQTMLEETASVQ